MRCGDEEITVKLNFMNEIAIIYQTHLKQLSPAQWKKPIFRQFQRYYEKVARVGDKWEWGLFEIGLGRVGVGEPLEFIIFLKARIGE